MTHPGIFSYKKGRLPNSNELSKKLINFNISKIINLPFRGEKMIKWSKLIYAGISASVIRYVINSGFGYYFQDLYDLTSGLWRAMPTPSWMQNVIISTALIAFLTVFVYAIVNKALGKKAEISKKGLKFGLLVWLIRDVPGSILTYVFMPVPVILIGTWLLSGIFISLINGLVIAKIYK